MPALNPRSSSHPPALRGDLIALLAAVLFGASRPLVQRFGAGVGSFSTAALLYAGAAVIGALLHRPIEREARVHPGDGRRLVAMALFGAVLGPVVLAWGLQHTSGTGASLMLTLEVVFTAALAQLWYHESLGRRAALAMALLTLGERALVLDRAQVGAAPMQGLLLLAAAAFGVDNTLSRAVAERDPGQVVMFKGTLGALATTLLAVGATGYGLSLRFYLVAQRAFGAARAGSVFAFAPFVGAALALALGERGGSLWMLAAAAMMAAGLPLHLTERHAHEHRHASHGA
jgi:drug/metabolite transporter (DMT)-like permease